MRNIGLYFTEIAEFVVDGFVSNKSPVNKFI